MLTYRKTKDGKWVAFGPADEVVLGHATVHKKNGETKKETIVRVGKSFDVDGVAHCYGYLQPKERGSGSRSRSKRWWKPCGYPGCSPDYCDECME